MVQETLLSPEGPPGVWTIWIRAREQRPSGWAQLGHWFAVTTGAHRPSQGRPGPHSALPRPPAPQLSPPLTCALPLAPSPGQDPQSALPALHLVSLESLVQVVMIRSLHISLSEVTVCIVLSRKYLFSCFSVIRQGCTSGSPIRVCDIGMHFTVTSSTE